MGQEIKDIKPPLDYPQNVWLFWIILIVVLITACVALWFWLKNKKAKNTFSSKPSWQLALDSIGQLCSQRLFENGHYNRFFTELSLILRHYIEERFNIRAAEMTTEEFLENVKNAQELTHKNLIAEFLRFSDEVKFAKHTPVKDDMDKAVKAVKDFICETKREQ
jgi:hypothetical protein